MGRHEDLAGGGAPSSIGCSLGVVTKPALLRQSGQEVKEDSVTGLPCIGFNHAPVLSRGKTALDILRSVHLRRTLNVGLSTEHVYVKCLGSTETNEVRQN